MKKENAINFLLYSYFKITLDSEEAVVIEAAINKAYQDASRRVLSITNETNKFYDEENKEVLPKKEAIAWLKLQISELELKKCDDYDKWFDATCKKLKEDIYKEPKNKEGNQAFTFGHAQKWVNMTMKYLYIIKNIFENYGKNILPGLTDKLECQLHVPADSYIMEAVKYSSAKAWSKWEESDYKNFREEICEKIAEESPLDWEGPAWIEIAKNRKEREKK